MKYWLVKSDPETYGWKELIADKKTDWTGVRNYAARIHLRAMKTNDLVLFYHSGSLSSVTGIARVTKEAFQDPTTNEDAWVAVELTGVKPLARDVSLTEVKQKKGLSNMALVKISRLSVQPVTEKEFQTILQMGETKL